MLWMFVICVLGVPSAGAQDEMYTFTSPNYVVYQDSQPLCPGSNVPCQGTETHISGSFTTTLSPAQLDNLRNFVIPNYDIASFSFTDNNSLDINQYNSILTKEFFMISTDAKGRILSGPPPGNSLVDWAFSLTISNGEMGAATLGEDFSQTTTTYGQTTLDAGGAWAGPIPGGAPVPTPEPSTILLFGVGLLCLVVGQWRYNCRKLRN